MENLTSFEPNYICNYTASQLSLPIDLTRKIEKSNEVVSFAEVMKGVDIKKYFKSTKTRGNEGYNKEALLKVILFAYSLGIRSLREIAKLCENDIRFMWLGDEIKPSHMALSRFLNNHLLKKIDEIFFEVSAHIATLVDADIEKQYIDGSKFEANAHKNSFVYKTRIVNAREKLCIKVSDEIQQLNAEYGWNYRTCSIYQSEEVGYITQYLMEVMVREDIEIKYGKGQRKSEFQRYYDLFLTYYLKLAEYEFWLSVIQERNSCSKIDNDATMMNTKYDYYNQTGVSKACYNAQISVSDGIIMNADLFQRPGDTKTFIPFMERYKEYTGKLPKYPVTDAGYGSYENYYYVLCNGLQFVQKYSYYAKKNDPAFKKKVYNTFNWTVNQEGYKVCPNGNVFDKHLYDKNEEVNEILKITQMYGSSGCKECPNKTECTKGENKVVSRNIILEQFYSKVDETLGTEEGKEMKKQRSIQAEGAFGVIKQNMKFTRFQRRGLENTKMEFLLVCIGYNLMKYHNYRIRNLNQIPC